MALFTPYSVTHFLSGIVLFLFFNIFYDVKISIILSIITHTIYEIKDFYFYFTEQSTQNTLINNIGDTISSILGIYFILQMDFKQNKKYFLIIYTLCWIIITWIIYVNNIEKIPIIK